MTEKDYQVTFVGDYFTTIVNVQGVEGGHDVAIDLAANILKHHYGWDIVPLSTVEISIVEINDGWFDIGEIRI